MSRGFVIGDIAILAAVVVVSAAHLFQKMGKVGFPKDHGTLSVAPLSYDLDSKESLVMPAYNEASPPLDGPSHLLETIIGIHESFPFSSEAFGALDGFAPLEVPVKKPMEPVPERPLLPALSQKVPQLPLLNQAAQEEPAKKSLDANSLKNLLAVFENGGMKVKEVEALPSGATKITFDEFMDTRKVREPELVRVRGKR